MNDPASAFAAQAREFCSLIEDGPAPNSWMFAQECLKQLLCLYRLALQLPDTAPMAGELIAGIEYEAWNHVREKVAGRLARDCYWVVFEPLEKEAPEAVAGSLSDDLADIWRDLKSGVAAIDADAAPSVTDLVWEWRLSFETHWGAHAASAIGALHSLCFGQYGDGSRPILRPPDE